VAHVTLIKLKVGEEQNENKQRKKKGYRFRFFAMVSHIKQKLVIVLLISQIRGGGRFFSFSLSS
jgi:hypothetical protein